MKEQRKQMREQVRKQMSRGVAFALSVAVTAGFLPVPAVQAKKPPVISKTALELDVGKSAVLKIKNTKKKITWFSSKKSVATVSQKGKVKAKKAGRAVITAKAGKIKLTCAVTVYRKVSYKTLKIEDFEDYESGTDWENYTLGEGLTSGGDEKPHYLDAAESMQVVADPENAGNKVLKVVPRFYSFCPVFTVDLAKLTGLSEKKLGEYAGVRVKIRVVSDASCHTGIGLGAFFGVAGSIDKRYAFNTYTTQEQALPEEREFYKFFHSKAMVSGERKEDGEMPQFTAGKHMAGHKFTEQDKKVGFAEKTLLFNKYLTSDLKDKTSFDFVIGGSYGTLSEGEYLAWYMDDVELIYK